MPTRSEIVAAARRYIGTPYHHQGALAGAGCDCLGLVRGVWRDLYGSEPETPPPYTPDWGEAGRAELLLEAGRRHLIEIDPADAKVGDVLAFRLRPWMIAKHVAILSSSFGSPATRMIHAQSGDRIREVLVTRPWVRRVATAFVFPGVVT